MQSEVAIKNITLIRGDTNTIVFSILGENGERYIPDDNDQLYFTVKENYFRTNCILQKKLGKGISFNDSTKEFEIEITSDCTCGLQYCRLVYDIELVIMRDGKKIVKTLCKGELCIDHEATHRENEAE